MENEIEKTEQVETKQVAETKNGKKLDYPDNVVVIGKKQFYVYLQAVSQQLLTQKKDVVEIRAGSGKAMSIAIGIAEIAKSKWGIECKLDCTRREYEVEEKDSDGKMVKKKKMSNVLLVTLFKKQAKQSV